MIGYKLYVDDFVKITDVRSFLATTGNRESPFLTDYDTDERNENIVKKGTRTSMYVLQKKEDTPTKKKRNVGCGRIFISV